MARPGLACRVRGTAEVAAKYRRMHRYRATGQLAPKRRTQYRVYGGLLPVGA